MRFELPIFETERSIDRPDEIRRNPDGSIDVDFYRRRAACERRLAQRPWLTRKILLFARLPVAVTVTIKRALGGAKPTQPCCSAREQFCCD